MKKRLLLLSNSTLPSEKFLLWPEKYIHSFLGPAPCKVLFFPFAGVTFSFDEYTQLVKDRLGEMGYEVSSAHKTEDKERALAACDALAVGGGNTFQLISYLERGWMELIRERVAAGVPYLGWSAGANAACPTLKTTNDMPIVQPRSFDALGLVDFQINPHYTEASIPNHGGETRPDRIQEYLTRHPTSWVYGLPEGSLLAVEGDQVRFQGAGLLKSYHSGGVNSFSDGQVVS